MVDVAQRGLAKLPAQNYKLPICEWAICPLTHFIVVNHFWLYDVHVMAIVQILDTPPTPHLCAPSSFRLTLNMATAVYTEPSIGFTKRRGKNLSAIHLLNTTNNLNYTYSVRTAQ